MSARFWLIAVLTGVGAGLAGGLLTLLLHGAQHLAFGYTENSFLFGVERASPARRVVVMAAAGLIAGTGWFALRRWVGDPGSVSTAIRSPDGRLPLVASLADATLQIVIVALGASLGREGAPRQAGAAWASQLSDWAGLDSGQRRLLMACGAGAGLAAVYNVPFGGAVFTLEVLLASLTASAVIPAVLTSVLATLTARAMLGNELTYPVGRWHLSVALLAFAALAGPVGGLAAIGFIRLTDYARAVRPEGVRLILATILVFTALGGVASAYPQLLGNGKGPAQLAFDGRGSLALLAALIVLKPLATAACLRSGATGGLFTPALATGAVLGAAGGKLWLDIWPGSSLGLFAVIGAAALLSTAVRAPAASIMLIFELTGIRAELMIPVAVAVLGSTVTARLLGVTDTTTAAAVQTAAG
jgi:H+/Cl- antiporter ClcA